MYAWLSSGLITEDDSYNMAGFYFAKKGKNAGFPVHLGFPPAVAGEEKRLANLGGLGRERLVTRFS